MCPGQATSTAGPFQPHQHLFAGNPVAAQWSPPVVPFDRGRHSYAYYLASGFAISGQGRFYQSAGSAQANS
jgi:hypothetical protein